MKKLMMTLIAMVTMTFSAQAMSYEQAREQALFLTDKMAYELNLTEDQYEAAYEVNLDYLLGVESQADLYGEYWTRRNLDLSYILLDWQYNAFCAASYFYRPLYWDAGYWHFGIYARYPHRTYFYFGRPHFWYTYRGGHAWHRVGGRGYYHGRTFGRAHHSAAGHRGFGMRSGYDRGDYRGRSGRAESKTVLMETLNAEEGATTTAVITETSIAVEAVTSTVVKTEASIAEVAATSTAAETTTTRAAHATP